MSPFILLQSPYRPIQMQALEVETELAYRQLKKLDRSNGSESPDTVTILVLVSLRKICEQDEFKTDRSIFIIQGTALDVASKTSKYEVHDNGGWASSTFWLTNKELKAELRRSWESSYTGDIKWRGMTSFGLMQSDNKGEFTIVVPRRGEQGEIKLEGTDVSMSFDGRNSFKLTVATDCVGGASSSPVTRQYRGVSSSKVLHCSAHSSNSLPYSHILIVHLTASRQSA